MLITITKYKTQIAINADQGLSPEFASMLLVVLIGGYTLVGGLGVITSITVSFQMPPQVKQIVIH